MTRCDKTKLRLGVHEDEQETQSKPAHNKLLDEVKVCIQEFYLHSEAQMRCCWVTRSSDWNGSGITRDRPRRWRRPEP